MKRKRYSVEQIVAALLIPLGARKTIISRHRPGAAHSSDRRGGTRLSVTCGGELGRLSTRVGLSGNPGPVLERCVRTRYGYGRQSLDRRQTVDKRRRLFTGSR